MAAFRWVGPEGCTLVHPATGVPVALTEGQVVDLPDHVAVSPELWAPVKTPTKKED